MELVDDANHIIMDYSIHDAIEAGFNHVVFIIRNDIEKEFKEAIGNRIAAICSSHKEVIFKASAAVPRLYRIKFGRDIYKDLRQLEKSVGENDEDNSNLDLFSLEMFEDLAWLMARHADPANVPDSPEEFLDQFNTFSIYQILPQLIELWGLNVQTEVESRKNLEKVSGK